MNLGSILYTILIGPLKLLFEVIYTIAYYLTGSAGISIIALSLVMNVLLMPLYKQADDVQAAENEIQKKLKKGVDHIKRSFKGDEQYMILSTYYRQNDYKPIYALRSSISLLLQIPFFIAAYDFLSNEHTVLSSSFGPISSLGSPDGLLFGLNLLPILMTLINIVSSLIYTKGQPFRQNIQLYIMALAFLVFLYDRPAGLVFYWTLNNLFSLIKNILSKIPGSDKVISYGLSLLGIVMFVYLLIRPMGTVTMQLGSIFISLIFQLPVILNYLKKKKALGEIKETAIDNSLFYLEIAFLCIYFGLFIPCKVIGSSPSEFLDTISLVNPLVYLANTFFLVLGSFAVWCMIYYSLMNNNIKRLFQAVLLLACVISAVDFLFFGTDLGTMSNVLVYHDGMQYSSSEIMINLVAVIILSSLLVYIYLYKKQFIKPVFQIAMIGMLVFSVVNIYRIQKDTSNALAAVNEAKAEKAEIQLSRSGKNVAVIILDRAINSYFPYIINEIDGLKEKYSGFTYYPNTISYGAHTNLAMPAVYGGYEYTPEEMDKRDSENLMDKHNEALKVLPVLFDNNGYNVTVFDPCYANYSYPSDLSIFNDYPDIRKYNTEIGMFEYDKSLIKNDLDTLNRNLFCFGLTKSVPLVLQNILYNGGAYNSISIYNDMYSEDSLSIMSFQSYIEAGFLRSYSVLQNMIGMTKINNDDSGDLLLMYNNTAHEPTLLQEPDYEIRTDIDNYDYDIKNNYSRSDENGNTITFGSYDQISHYHANLAAIRELGNWFDYLKQNGVYDNTKIIIVADHGKNLNQYKDMIYTYKDGEQVDLMYYNPILLVKDYNEKEFKIDNSFMTNADVASITVRDTIDNPLNPFTGKLITDQSKYESPQHVFMSDNYMIHINNGKKYIPGKWMYVKDNLFDLNNWTEDQNQ